MRAGFWFALMLARFFCLCAVSSMAEQGTHNPLVAGSSPARRTIFFEKMPSEPFGGDDERRLLREWASRGCVLESIARKAVI